MREVVVAVYVPPNPKRELILLRALEDEVRNYFGAPEYTPDEIFHVLEALDEHRAGA